MSWFFEQRTANRVDAARRAAFSTAIKIYEPVINCLKSDVHILRHEVARLKVYEEFVLGRGKQYGALRRARLRK